LLKNENDATRQVIDKKWAFNSKIIEAGTMIFIRRTDNDGYVKIMGHQWELDEN
jgi:hypothetical protein